MSARDEYVRVTLPTLRAWLRYWEGVRNGTRRRNAHDAGTDASDEVRKLRAEIDLRMRPNTTRSHGSLQEGSPKAAGATMGLSVTSATKPQRRGSTLERCFVQFMHPGGEHGPDSGRLKHWNVGDHKRKFIRLEGDYLPSADAAGTPSRAELALWAEWEPESDVESLRSTVPDGPEWVHRPFYERPTAFRRDGRVLQNTDPFVFGDHFLYTVCRQWRRTRGVYRPTFLRDLDRGSLILFGSHKGGEFVLDTVFVVGDSVLHDAASWPATVAGLVPEAYADVTLRPAYEWGGGEELRLYLGATPGDPVHGMFSFVPCRSAADTPSGFARPTIRLEGLITPSLAMGAKATRDVSAERVRSIWESIVGQVLEQGLVLGTRFDVPERRDPEPVSSMPQYVERRIRRPKPDGCRVLPSSTPVVAFGNPSASRVATLGLNPSRVEFEVDGHELDSARRRFETLGSLGLHSLEDAPAPAVAKVWERCNGYFQGNPYRRWFDLLEEVLNAVGASYYDGSACHLDLSQWATDPTWSGLDASVRDRLVVEDAEFLAEQLRTEPIELLLLNGRGVIDGFVNALDGQLTQVPGVVNDGGAPTAFFLGSFEDVRVVGWSTNLQSSYGVTRVLRERIAARVRELAEAP